VTRRLHVVAQVHGFPPATNAGAEWMLAPMLAALAARGHRVEVRLSQPVPAHPDPWTLDGVRVLPPGSIPAGPRPDVYVTHLNNTVPVADLARGYGVPLVLVLHNTRRDAELLPAASPALAVVNSEWMASQLSWAGTTVLVRPPVDAGTYQTTPGTLVTQINLTPGKGAPLFWEVARQMPGTGFLAVKGSYGEQVIPPVVPPNVTVLDCMDGRLMRDDVYARTRILMVPSNYESWGRVATEAMCSGIPVIAHQAEGALVENLGGAAIWASRDNPAEWVTQIRRLAKPAAWLKASEAAQKRYAELDPAGELEAWCRAVEALAP
jgi:glycosyltransferase involved in cell wall biosynthesis